MADKRIDQLDAADALSGTEPVPVYQGGTTKRATAAAIAALAAAGVTVSNTAPTSPAQGALWLDTTGTPAVLKVWVDGSPGAWRNVNTAATTTYDNTASGLAATNAQAAIDEVVGLIPSGGGNWLDSVEGWAWGGTAPNWRDLVGGTRVDTGMESSNSTGSFTISGRALSSSDLNAGFFETSASTAAATLNRGVGVGSIRTVGFVRRADLFPKMQGFKIRMRFGFGDTSIPLKSDSRILVGVWDAITTPAQTARIDSFLNLFGIGKDDNESGLQLIRAAGPGTYTSTSLGVTTASVSGIPLCLTIEAGANASSGISYSLVRLDTDAVLSSGTVTANIPGDNIQLRPVMYINSGNLTGDQCKLYYGGWNWISAQPGA